MTVNEGFDSVGAIVVLHTQSGLSMLKAKRLVEELMDRGSLVAQLPTVPDIAQLQQLLEKAGVASEITLDVERLIDLESRARSENVREATPVLR